MSDSETPRPRAQYGEYATPEEQQRARGLPEQPDTPGPDAADSPRPAAAERSHQRDVEPVPPATPAPPVQGQPNSAQPTGGKSKAAHPVDRVVTIVLLAVGLFLFLNGIPGYLALPDALQMVYDQLDAGTYPATEVASSLGVTALVVQGLIWIATAASAWFAMKRGRLAWWIALLGGVLSFIASMVIVSIALFADPGFLDNVSPQNLP